MIICTNCGYGQYKVLPQMATWHVGECDKCGKKDVVVTEERDFRRIAIQEIGGGLPEMPHLPDEALDREHLY